MNAVETRAQERFRSDTSEHEMTVLHDDGLYRHLRFSAPKTYCYGFDLITWPGYLAIVGDVQDHVFSRIADMFKFFESSPNINPDYWSEKIPSRGDREATRVYSSDVYRSRVLEWLAEHVEDMEEDECDDAEQLKAAVYGQLLDHPPYNQHEAIERLYAFAHDGFRISEPYEWNLTEWDGHYLWCCWAIVWGIEQYREAEL